MNEKINGESEATEHTPIDSVQELTEKIAAGGSVETLYKHHRDRINILQLNFRYQESADRCCEGIEAFDDSEELRRLLRNAITWGRLPEEKYEKFLSLNGKRF